jgi:hypothetical protein
MPGMLYYPFADAPQPVIQQAVLYWDSLSTVWLRVGKNGCGRT